MGIYAVLLRLPVRRLPNNCRYLAIGYLVIWLPYASCCGEKCKYSGLYVVLLKLPGYLMYHAVDENVTTVEYNLCCTCTCFA